MTFQKKDPAEGEPMQVIDEAGRGSAPMQNPVPEPEHMEPVGEFSAAELQARQLQNEADQIKARQSRMDETVPGGKYVVSGQFVDAEGKPVK